MSVIEGRKAQTKTWTKEVHWSEVARVVKLLRRAGIIEHIPESRLRRELQSSKNVQFRKTGPEDSHPAFYRSRRSA